MEVYCNYLRMVLSFLLQRRHLGIRPMYHKMELVADLREEPVPTTSPT